MQPAPDQVSVVINVFLVLVAAGIVAGALETIGRFGGDCTWRTARVFQIAVAGLAIAGALQLVGIIPALTVTP